MKKRYILPPVPHAGLEARRHGELPCGERAEPCPERRDSVPGTPPVLTRKEVITPAPKAPGSA
jgi:hypothetical protein